jgi:glutaredoxin
MIDLYTKPNCAFCVQAKNLLNRHHQVFREIPIGESILVEELKERFPEARTAPVVVMDGVFIGGYQQLQNLFESNAQLLTE